MAYTGAGQSHEAFSAWPELTTSGMPPKAWRLIEGKGIHLYKGGTQGAFNTGREPYCELYASQIATTMGLSVVQYDFMTWRTGRELPSPNALCSQTWTRRLLPLGASCAMEAYKAALAAMTRSFATRTGILAVLACCATNHSGRIISPAPILDNTGSRALPWRVRTILMASRISRRMPPA